MCWLRSCCRRLVGAFVLPVLFLACSEPTSSGPSQGAALPDNRPAPVEARWVDAVVPAGTTMHLILSEGIGSATSRSGDLFRATLKEPVRVEGSEILAANSVFQGTVSQVTPASKGRDPQGGALLLLVKTVYTPTGAGAAFNAEFSEIGEGTKVPGGLSLSSGSTSGKAGAALVEAHPGKDVLLEAGTPFAIVLSEPLTIKVKH